MSIYSCEYKNSGYSFYINGERVPGGMPSVVKELQQLEAQLAALKEENERLQARVAGLEKGSISKSLIISRLQKLPDEHRMNWHYAEIICGIIDSINDGEFDNKEQANEG